MNETAPTPDLTPAAEQAAAAEPLAAPPQPTRADHDPIFGDAVSLLDDGIARANWAVPWSDLMMTMFVLFAALLAAQTMHGRQRQEAVERKTVEIHEQTVTVERESPVPEETLSPKPSFEPLMQINVLARSQEAVREANLQNAEILLMDDQSVKVSVQGPMFFHLGKADLRPDVMQFLDRLAQIIRQTPYEIHVVGHTDDRPISTALFPSNWELSLVRASQVARYLIKSGNLAPTRFVVMGRGEYEPAATNADERSRALNRRVEIVITRTVTDSERAKR